jgi:RNA polymerase sigma-70 factor (ECF subfamily)
VKTIAAPRMNPAAPSDDSREALERLLGALRPKLHRYCARMTGSVIDGEDVVQEAIVKAIEAFPAAAVTQPEAWLFRIAHNAALDFLRRRARRDAAHGAEDPDMIEDPLDRAAQREIAQASLHTFMRLPVAQRSSVILMDVLGYSLEEIGTVIDATIPAVKAALHRGRARLRELAAEPEDRPVPRLAAPERARLAAYIDRFNARDFDAVRDMLAEDVRLELVARSRLNGKREVARYFTNYASVQDWRFAIGFVEGRPAAIARNPADASGAHSYFVLLDWTAGRVARIRDFRHARYAVADADVIVPP